MLTIFKFRFLSFPSLHIEVTYTIWDTISCYVIFPWKGRVCYWKNVLVLKVVAKVSQFVQSSETLRWNSFLSNSKLCSSNKMAIAMRTEGKISIYMYITLFLTYKIALFLECSYWMSKTSFSLNHPEPSISLISLIHMFIHKVLANT